MDACPSGPYKHFQICHPGINCHVRRLERTGVRDDNHLNTIVACPLPCQLPQAALAASASSYTSAPAISTAADKGVLWQPSADVQKRRRKTEMRASKRGCDAAKEVRHEL